MIVRLGPDRFASYNGSHMEARGDLDHVTCVRKGELPPLPRLRRRSFRDLPPTIPTKAS